MTHRNEGGGGGEGEKEGAQKERMEWSCIPGRARGRKKRESARGMQETIGLVHVLK